MWKQCKYLTQIKNKFTCKYYTDSEKESENNFYKIPMCPTDSGTDNKCNGKCYETDE